MKRKYSRSWSITLVIASILLTLIIGCDYEAPITAEPTRTIEPEKSEARAPLKAAAHTR